MVKIPQPLLTGFIFFWGKKKAAIMFEKFKTGKSLNRLKKQGATTFGLFLEFFFFWPNKNAEKFFLGFGKPGRVPGFIILFAGAPSNGTLKKKPGVFFFLGKIFKKYANSKGKKKKEKLPPKFPPAGVGGGVKTLP